MNEDANHYIVLRRVEHGWVVLDSNGHNMVQHVTDSAAQTYLRTANNVIAIPVAAVTVTTNVGAADIDFPQARVHPSKDEPRPWFCNHDMGKGNLWRDSSLVQGGLGSGPINVGPGVTQPMIDEAIAAQHELCEVCRDMKRLDAPGVCMGISVGGKNLATMTLCAAGKLNRREDPVLSTRVRRILV